MTSRIHLLEMRREWTAPDRLDRSRPREVRLSRTGAASLVVAVTLLSGALAAGIGLGLMAGRQAADARLLREQGVVTEGRVTRLWRSRGDDRQPWFTYRFYSRELAFDRNARVSLGTWRNLQVGSSIPVYHVPARPDLNSPFSPRKRVMPAWLPFLVALGLAAGSVLVWLPVRRQRALLAGGRVAPASVISHGKMIRDSHRKELGFKYCFQFPLLSGAVARGQAGPTKTPPAIGSVIPILYDPESPMRNSPYPLTLVRLAHTPSRY